MPATAKKTTTRTKAKTTAIVRSPKTGFKKRPPATRYMPSPSGADLRRWSQIEGMGMSADQVAAIEKTNILNVQASLDYIKEWKMRNSTAMLETKAVEVAMAQMDDIGKLYQRGMKAEKVLFVHPKTGKVKKGPDIAMQLKTAGEVRALIETVQPKGPALQVNQQFNNGVGGTAFGSSVSFEAILRKKREEHGLANSQDVQIIEGELSHEEQIADEFKDFGGTDDDEDDDEEDEDQ